MTWNKVKWIAIISMLIDHAPKIFLPQIFLIDSLGMSMSTSYQIISGMRYIGRIAFPIFAFGIAQGCVYTKDAKKYLSRLLLFAILSEIPYNLAFSNSIIFRFINVFFTLFLGAVCCYIHKYFRDLGKAWISIPLMLIIALSALLLETDYGFAGVLMIAIPYIFFSSKPKCLFGLAVMTTLLYTVVYNFNPIVYGYQWSIDWLTCLIFALLGVAVLFLYNGKPGSQKQKWVFYFLYPGHLLVFYLLSCLF